jgi:sigma-B regulation protein RsbU (phosphoserine phosphatase)
MANDSPKSRPILRDRTGRPTLGFLAHSISDGYGLLVWQGVMEGARAAGVNLLCFLGGDLNTTRGFERQANILYDLASGENVDGLIVSGGPIVNLVGTVGLEAFCSHYHPLPMATIAVGTQDAPCVLVDNYHGVRAALSHLVEMHGLRRIAFIGGPPGHHEADERYRAYKDTLARCGLPLDPDLVTAGNFVLAAGAQAVSLLLDQRKSSFEAVVAANDNMALGAMEALQARGIQVPTDVAVVGFDNIEETQFATPPLTTVRQPIREQACLATEIVLSQLRDEPVLRQVILSTKLVVRQSCGCPCWSKIARLDCSAWGGAMPHPIPKRTPRSCLHLPAR